MATIDKTHGATVPDWAAVGKKVAICQLSREGWRVWIREVTKTTATQVEVDDDRYQRFNAKNGLEEMGRVRRDSWGPSTPFLADPSTPGVIEALRVQRKETAAYAASKAADVFAKDKTFDNAIAASMAFRQWATLELEDQERKAKDA